MPLSSLPVFLLATVGIVGVKLNSSVNGFLEKTRAPHFLQMHMGDFDPERMADFAKKNDKVQAYQTIGFLNVASADILINGRVFTESSQDNGFSCQSTEFDFLLDLDGRVAYPEEGEVYIPMAYYTSGLIGIGDRLSLGEREFLVKGPIRDGQMSSMLSSSKRFLIHPADYEKIQALGREEFLIEFLLKDYSMIEDFQADYGAAKLENKGPTITYSIIKLINSLTDGLMIALLFLIGFLTLLVSFLCIRLTLVAKVEDEYRIIGVLKAIGMGFSSIKKIYLGKYGLIGLLGSGLGFVLSLAFSGLFLKNIYLYFGDAGGLGPSLVSGLGGSLLVFFMVLAYTNIFLRRLKNISPAVVINRGRVPESVARLNKFKLRDQKFLETGYFLGLNSVLSRKKTYLTLALILIISSFVMVLPTSINSTIKSDDFIAYMGLGNGDLMVIFPQGRAWDGLGGLEEDPDLEKYSFYDHKIYDFYLDEDTISKIQVILGDQEAFPLSYTEGRAPLGDGEIGLSYLNADSLEKKLGDKISLLVGGQKKDFLITGIYSDITNGGKTARASFRDEEARPCLQF